MHAYKDAIRRTYGAYILYPGLESGSGGDPYYSWIGYHEVLPGLGAFTVRPGEDQEVGLKSLKEFFEDIFDNMDKDESLRQHLSCAAKSYCDSAD